MALLEGIRHISFDLWLTLICSNPEYKSRRAVLMAQHFGVRRSDAEVQEVFTYHDRLFNRINERAGGNVQYSEMLYVILDRLGVPPDAIEEEAMTAYYQKAELLFFEHMPRLLDTGTAGILEALRAKGHTLSILSNTGFILGRTLRPVLERLGIAVYFDFQLYSDEIGSSKPSFKAYGQLMEASARLRPLEKEELLHVGDNPIADLEGARRFGFRSALLEQDATLRNLFLN
ncbi:HAD family hydrolase [Taibaiella koreensis]|uniref:HAD family hydrolase n=1 Tax=Taibaiella koreensis TaxID=1268548 RepID=UPI000E59D16E|nr:HAD family hydrolase [Taibaiella koreensis]